MTPVTADVERAKDLMQRLGSVLRVRSKEYPQLRDRFARIEETAQVWTASLHIGHPWSDDNSVPIFWDDSDRVSFEKSYETLVNFAKNPSENSPTHAYQNLDSLLDEYLTRLSDSLDSIPIRGLSIKDIEAREDLYSSIALQRGRLANLRGSDQLAVLLAEARRSAEEAKSANAETNASKLDAQKAASVASEASLSGHFASLATEEFAAAGKYRVATICAIGVGIVVGGIVHFAVGISDLPSAIYNLGLVAAVFALAGYLGRQSASHRNVALWAKTIQVQLLTFDAFLGPITNEDSADEVRRSFASRVFGAVPSGGKEEGDAIPSTVVEQLLSLATKASAPK
ncbi:hypothetical protein [Arthrobacter burdickii]|uniref:Uncharacterized protein n=1 Tax=Arthrobacter burdickii TaxID=3035920 RepID=A0ABT8K4P0_9MICC|nr:hypothetical protein [Arthrobacter burdickii]MDN4611968.1 hypothetical protein [Arthrobacter burdickii]